MISLALSLENANRQRRLEKKLFLEPYFQSVWPKLYNNLVGHLEITRYWISEIKNAKNTKDFFPLRDDCPSIGIDADARKYDRNLSHARDEYASSSYTLSELVRSYNNLIYPTAESNIIHLSTDKYAYFCVDISAEKKSNIQAIYIKYTGRVDGVDIRVLEQNADYQNDLRSLKHEVILAANNLEIASESLERFTRLLAAHFAEKH